MSHCEGCPFMSCHDCEYQGGTEPGEVVPQPDSGGVEGSAQRANGAEACDNGEADEAAPTGVRQHSSRGLTTGTSPRPLSPRRQA